MSEQTAAIVIGASGGIGQALVANFVEHEDIDIIVAVSRAEQNSIHALDTRVRYVTCSNDEPDIERLIVSLIAEGLRPRYIVIATGMLHDKDQGIHPEKRINELSQHAMETVYYINTVVPMLWLKHLSKLLNRSDHTTMAVLSARVSSISDNRLGGWYSYRASKTALNMLLKTLSIEFKLRFPNTKVIAFHPGTTDTALSKPFQAKVPKEKLFSPDFVAERLASLLVSAKPDGQISFKDWDHQDIDW